MKEEVDLRQNPESAAEMAANAVFNYLCDCRVEGEPQKRQWIRRVFDRVDALAFSH